MKNIIIGILLLITIGLLVYVATQPTIKTQPITPTQEIKITEQPTPRAEDNRGTPTPRAEEIIPTTPGTPVELTYPQEVQFWVNEIQVPDSMSYEQYIPLKKSNLKTFAGTFGPYTQEPKTLKVALCAELYTSTAAPNCETIQTIYRDGYVSFAKGYQYDEYIGGMAAKDYTAYYDVYLGNTKIATSKKAIIRTVKD